MIKKKTQKIFKGTLRGIQENTEAKQICSGIVAGGARNLWSEQPLAPPAEDVLTGLEFLVDLPMRSLVDKQDERKKRKKMFRHRGC